MTEVNNGQGGYSDADFLPAGYEPPKQTSGYMSLDDGANKLLILGSAVVGYEYWNTSDKPVRLAVEPEESPADIRRDKDGKPERVKHFWAFPVWNFEEERVQILEITQVSIMRAITALVKNPDWGSPVLTYPITISREGEKLKTKYTITPSPAKDIDPAIMEAWEETHKKGFDLKRLFTGGNPFSEEEAS